MTPSTDPAARLIELDRLAEKIARERRRLLAIAPRDRRSRHDIPPCGTETGYQRHYWRGEDCEPCRVAHAAHNRAQYRAAQQRRREQARAETAGTYSPNYSPERA